MQDARGRPKEPRPGSGGGGGSPACSQEGSRATQRPARPRTPLHHLPCLGPCARAHSSETHVRVVPLCAAHWHRCASQVDLTPDSVLDMATAAAQSPALSPSPAAADSAAPTDLARAFEAVAPPVVVREHPSPPLCPLRRGRRLWSRPAHRSEPRPRVCRLPRRLWALCPSGSLCRRPQQPRLLLRQRMFRSGSRCRLLRNRQLWPRHPPRLRSPQQPR